MEESKNTLNEESLDTAAADEATVETPNAEDSGILSKLGAFCGKVVNKITSLKKKTLIILSTVIVLVLGGAITAGAYFNSPKVVAANAVTGFVEDLFEREEFEPILGMLDKGSLEASISKLESEGENKLGASFSGKMYFGKDALMLENINVSANGMKVNGNLYISEDMIYISEDELIKEAFGAEFENLADDLKDSIFAYGSGSDYELPEYVYDTIVALLEKYEDNKDFVKDAEKLLKDVFKDVYKIIYKNAEVEKENDKVKINGDKISARVITITIDNKAVAEILEQVYEYLEENDDIVEFLEKYEDNVNPLLESNGITEEGKGLVDLYEDFLDEMGESVDQLCEQLKDKSSKFKVSAEIVTPKMSSKLLKLTIKADKTELVSIEVGKKGIKKTDKIVIASGETELAYEIEENNSKVYEAKVTLDYGYSDMGKETLLTIEIDKKKDEFKLVAGDVTVKGDVSKKGKVTTIGVDKIETTTSHIDWESYDEDMELYWDGEISDYPDSSDDKYQITETVTITTDLEIIINTSDKIPSAPKDYKTIADIKEEDIEAWGEKLAGKEE